MRGASTLVCSMNAAGSWATPSITALVPPGTFLRSLRPDVAAEVGRSVRVVAPATHETASAVAATTLPANGSTAFLSSGTWSLIGVELEQPIVSMAAREGNLTNEGGVAGTIRLLKNVMGLWLVQEARRAVAIGGSTLSYEQLSAMAQAARGFTAFIDPDDERFLRPGDLPT